MHTASDRLRVVPMNARLPPIPVIQPDDSHEEHVSCVFQYNADVRVSAFIVSPGCDTEDRFEVRHSWSETSSFVLAVDVGADRSSASPAGWLAQGLAHDMRDRSFGCDPVYLADIARQDRFQSGNLRINLIHDLT